MTHPNAAPIENVPPAAEIGRRRYATHEDYLEANRVRSREKQRQLRREDPEGMLAYERSRAEQKRELGRAERHTYRRLRAIAAVRGCTVEVLLDMLERG